VISIPMVTFDAAVLEAQLDGEALNPMLQGKLMMFIKKLRAQVSSAEAAAAPSAAAVAVASTTPLQEAPAPGPVAPTVTAGAQAKRKLSEVLDVVDDTLMVPLSTVERKAAREHHRVVTGGNPPEHAAPTTDQLAALKTKLSYGSPYVDFTIFGPFGRRRLQMRKFTAQTFVDGALVTKTLAGPSNFEAWLSCWEVFRAAMIMLDGASPSTLDAYCQGIRELVAIHPGYWGVIAVADEIMRAEVWDRMAEDEEDKDTLPDERPWDYIIRVSAFGSGLLKAHWWDLHVVYPCTNRSTTKVVEGAIMEMGQNFGSGGAKAKRSERAVGNKSSGKGQSSTGTTCWNWNRGSCASQGPCPNGFQHSCTICGGGHRSSQCGKNGGGKGNNKGAGGGQKKKSRGKGGKGSGGK
jgi:hypothetical protein